MKLLPILLGCSVLALSACGGGGGGDGIPTALSTIRSAGGIDGHVGSTTGGVEDLNLKLSNNDATATVTIGGTTRTFARTSQDDVQWRGIESGTGDRVTFRYQVTGAEYFFITGSPNFDGYTGLPTDPSRLPSSATYTGSYALGGDTTLYFDSTANVNFTTNSIGGTISADNLPSGGSTVYTGTLSGSVSGNSFTMSSTGSGTGSGSVDFEGNFYSNGNIMAGGASGTVNGSDVAGPYLADQ